DGAGEGLCVRAAEHPIAWPGSLSHILAGTETAAPFSTRHRVLRGGTQVMSHKNPRYSQPDRLTGPMPPPEIIEAPRVPRLRLLVALRLSAGSDPVKVALSAARFISTVQAAGRTLRLLVDPTPVCGADGEVMLTF